MGARSITRIVFVLFVVSAMVVSGCNTMSGMGRDISSAGNSMERSAECNK